MFPQVEGPFKEDGPLQERGVQGCRGCGCVPAGVWKLRVKQDGVRRCRVRPSTWGIRELQPPGRTASTAVDHKGRGDRRQSLLRLLQCRTHLSSLPTAVQEKERGRRGGERRTRGWSSWSSLLPEAGVLEDG